MLINLIIKLTYLTKKNGNFLAHAYKFEDRHMITKCMPIYLQITRFICILGEIYSFWKQELDLQVLLIFVWPQMDRSSFLYSIKYGEENKRLIFFKKRVNKKLF